jgi:carbon monoxide dehydrogenase subunit G
MAAIHNTTLIERAPEEVFDYLVELRNELEWNPGVESMEKLTDGPLGVGTKYLAKWKQSRLLEVECTCFARPREWVYVNGGPVAVTFTARLTPEGAGTRLTTTFDARPNGWFRLVFPIFLLLMRRQEQANMAQRQTGRRTPLQLTEESAHLVLTREQGE